MAIVRAVVGLGFALLAACGSSDGSGGSSVAGTGAGGGAASPCPAKGSCASKDGKNCTDFGDPAVAMLPSSCNPSMETPSAGGCNRAGALGGCLAYQGNACTVRWYDKPSGLTVDQVKQICANDGSQFVGP